MTIELIVLIVSIPYVLLVSLFIVGLRKPRDNNGTARPFVSVIIAARNEEESLPHCLDTVLNQTYPESLYEVIVVNDHSTDSTEEICKDYAAKYQNFTYTNAQEQSTARGKANALACGIEKAKGEVILITDADCRVPSTWIEHTARRFEPHVGLSGGVTLPESSNWFTGVQTLDWAYTLGMAASTAALGNQHGSIGNNLAFRKIAYENTGGYRKLKFSVTEDYTLVQAILTTKQWEYVYPIDPNVLVTTKPCHTFKALLHQKHRWGKGALDMKFTGFLIFAVGFLMHATILSLVFMSQAIAAVTMFFIKLTMDYIFLYTFLNKLNQTNELRWFYYFEIYFLLYVLILPFLVFFGGKVKWKEREF